MTTITSAQKEEASLYLSICTCLVCNKPVDELATAVFSRRNKAFLHYECRDMVFAQRALKAVAKHPEKPVVNHPEKPAQPSAIDSEENCVICGELVDLSEECWMSGGKARHIPCRPTSSDGR